MKTNNLWITLVLIGALLLAGCGSKDDPGPVVPEGAKAGDLVDLKSCTYKAGDVEYSAD